MFLQPESNDKLMGAKEIDCSEFSSILTGEKATTVRKHNRGKNELSLKWSCVNNQVEKNHKTETMDPGGRHSGGKRFNQETNVHRSGSEDRDGQHAHMFTRVRVGWW